MRLFCCGLLSAFLWWPPIDALAIEEKLSFVFADPGVAWEVIQEDRTSGQQRMITFARLAGTEQRAPELVSIRRFAVPGASPTPKNALARLQQHWEATCPGGTEWNVIGEDQDSILYEWHTTSCIAWPHQYQIGRILFGRESIFIVRYIAIANAIPEARRTATIGALSAAKIVIRP